MVAPLVRRGLAHQIAPSEYVAGAVGERCTVVPNGVASVAEASVSPALEGGAADESAVESVQAANVSAHINPTAVATIREFRERRVIDYLATGARARISA